MAEILVKKKYNIKTVGAGRTSTNDAIFADNITWGRYQIIFHLEGNIVFTSPIKITVVTLIG